MIICLDIIDLCYRWTYADPSWARIAALVPIVVSCAEEGDEVANNILLDAVEELALSVKAVVQRLGLSGEGMISSLNCANLFYVVLCFQLKGSIRFLPILSGYFLLNGYLGYM